jgi:rare lipoprotein A
MWGLTKQEWISAAWDFAYGALAIILASALGIILFFATAKAETGIASVYWEDILVANGMKFSPQTVSCAHWTLPLGTFVHLVYKKRSVECVILDRGPHPRLHRMIDLTPEAARHLGLPRDSLVTLKMTPASAPLPRPRP